MLAMQRTQVQSLVRELRVQKLYELKTCRHGQQWQASDCLEQGGGALGAGPGALLG